MVRTLTVFAAFAVLAMTAPAPAAEDGLGGVWRGTLTLDNPRAKEPRIETKAALHLRDPMPRELYVERLGRALPVAEFMRNANGTLDVYAGAGELRNIRLARDKFDGSAMLETDDGVVWQGCRDVIRLLF